jgi:hypothetical protein
MEHALMNGSPIDRIVRIHTFRGDRTRTFGHDLFRSLDDERHGRGAGPSETEFLLFVGHTGISVGADTTVYGFNLDRGTDPTWRVMQRLRSGVAYPGIVRDDTAVFTAAEQHGLRILRFDVVLSLRSFRAFRRRLTAERRQSRYSYGFPDGDGDCNCTTWIERLGLPLLTGRMDELTAVMGVVTQLRRRFGV